MAAAKPDRPTVVRKVFEEAGHAHHGGAWKVAYADFVTAMMAFFMLLWLLSTSSDQKLAGLAEFFSDAKHNTGPPGGAGGILDGIDLSHEMKIEAPPSPFEMRPNLPVAAEDQPEIDERTVSLGSGADGGARSAGEIGEAAFEAERERREKQQFAAVARALEKALEASAELRKLKDNLEIEQTAEGLRIQLIDRDQASMFPVGSDQMYPYTQKLLTAVAAAIRALPNRLSIRGHTDSLAYATDAHYDNWRLSSDRANATRVVLVTAGLDRRRIAEVVGKADAEPFLADQPAAPGNRRISIVLLHGSAAEAPQAPRASPPGGATTGGR